MKTITDQSFGVIPIHQLTNESWEVFVIHQRSHRGDIYWTFPKGHADTNESPEQAALRELQEETSLRAELDTNATFEQSYTFEHEGVLVQKTVQYFLGTVTDTTYTLQPEEVVAAQWCSFAQARELLTHEASKATLNAAETYLLE